MDVSTPPSLDLACPQAEADNDKYVHMFRDRGVDKIKYGHEGIMIILITATATSRALRWFSLEEERVMQQSSISISLSFENQGINPVGDNTQVT